MALSGIFQFSSDLSKKRTQDHREKAINIIRHVVLNSLKSIKKKYTKEYGEMVIACDGQNYWRKQFFPYYKANRKKDREESDLDWGLIFDTINELRQDLEENFQYKVIRIDGAEADDVIATLTKWTQDNGLISTGLYEEPQKVLIISSDGDFKQLQKYPNVRQWSPMQKKFIQTKEPQKYLLEHITKAGDDGIPNILSNDNVFVEGIRQTPVRAARLEEFVELGIDACRNDTEHRNWQRNQTLIDFDFIPEHISKAIIDSYMEDNIVGSKQKIMNYLIKNKCRQLLDDIEGF